MELTEEYLRDAYEVKNISIYEIAENCDTYPNKIRRKLIKYKIKIKNKSEAQTNAIKQGRHQHPTKGTQRSKEVREKISDSMALSWENMPITEKNRRIDLAKKQWSNMSLEEKENLKKMAKQAVRITSIEGSRLEKFLLIELRQRKFYVFFHAEEVVCNENLQIDLFLPKNNVAIEIDGPAHFYPIWGEENLAKHLLSDSVKTGLLLQAGYVLIRIKHLVKNTAKIHERRLLTTVLSVLESIRISFPPPEKRLIEIEVK